jgi:hypothetical protein
MATKADDKRTTYTLRPWRTPTVTHIPQAYSAVANLMGDSMLWVKTQHREQHGRLLQEKGGRSPNFDAATAARMMDKLKDFCVQEQNTTGHLPVEKRIKNFVMDELLPAEGVTSSYDITRKQIVAPVLRSLRPQRRKNKSD